jgi:HAD superfamily hydrolase (TIGR01450 family)
VLSEAFDVFLFDLDGVVYVGGRTLPHAAEALSRLREDGRVLRFVTNDPRPTRADLAARLNAMGVEAAVEEIASAGWAAALHVREQGFSPVYALGSEGLEHELREAGLELVGAGEQPAAVVVSADERLSYRHLREATAHLLAGAAFVATSADGAFPTEQGLVPATGAVVAALRAATGRRPTIVGKPEAALFAAACRGLPEGARVAMVGDRLESDVVGAQRFGLSAILVSPTLDVAGPDAVVADLRGLFDPAIGLRPRRTRRPLADRIAPGVAAIVLDRSGRVLLARRAGSGPWEVPWGQVEPGETVIEAAKRRVRDDAGIEVDVRTLVGVYSEPEAQTFDDRDGETVQFVTTCLLCAAPVDAEPRLAGAVEVAFFAPDALPAEGLSTPPCWLADAQAATTGSFVR